MCVPPKLCFGPEWLADLSTTVLSVTDIIAPSIIVLVTLLALPRLVSLEQVCLRAHLPYSTPRAIASPPNLFPSFSLSYVLRGEHHRTYLCGPSSVPTSEGSQGG